ncbi:MAG: hypothetical protein R3B60_02480 [Candidatus Paceibacterota bacterium]
MISFGTTVNIWREFNTYEALFWLILSLVVFLFKNHLPSKYKNWIIFSSINVFLFGVSDIVEIYTEGFLHTAKWLLCWKALHVVGLVISFGWYIKLRLKSYN